MSEDLQMFLLTLTFNFYLFSFYLNVERDKQLPFTYSLFKHLQLLGWGSVPARSQELHPHFQCEQWESQLLESYSFASPVCALIETWTRNGEELNLVTPIWAAGILTAVQNPDSFLDF